MSESQARPNILLFGLGGIGGVYACILALSNQCDIHVVARSNYASVKEKGLKFVSSKFGNHDKISFAGVFRDCGEAAATGLTFEYVLCANKALLDAKPSLSDHIKPIISKQTSIVILQNGVGAEAPLHTSFPNNTIISAVVWTGGKVIPDGVEQFNRESLTIGVDYREGGDGVEEDAKLEGLVTVLRAGGGQCDVVREIQSERWIKVVWNCCWNSLTTLSRLRTNPYFLSSPGALPLCTTIMTEVVAVATAKGLSIPPDTIPKLIKQCTDIGGDGLPSSMMFDNLNGRAMETEVILGVPVKEGQRLGVPVPTLLTLYTLVKALDYGNAHPEVRIDGQGP